MPVQIMATDVSSADTNAKIASMSSPELKPTQRPDMPPVLPDRSPNAPSSPDSDTDSSASAADSEDSSSKGTKISSLLRMVSRKDGKELRGKHKQKDKDKSKSKSKSKPKSKDKDKDSSASKNKGSSTPTDDASSRRASKSGNKEKKNAKTSNINKVEPIAAAAAAATRTMLPARELPPNPAADPSDPEASSNGTATPSTAPPALPPRNPVASSPTPSVNGSGSDAATLESSDDMVPSYEAPPPPNGQLMNILLDDAASRAPPPPPPTSFTKNLISLFKSSSTTNTMPEETGSKHPLQKRNLMQPVDTPFVAGVWSPPICRDALCIDWAYGTIATHQSCKYHARSFVRSFVRCTHDYCHCHHRLVVALTSHDTGRRSKVLNEILATEESYCRGLELLKAVYEDPLEKAIHEGKPIIREHEVRFA
jgi:hypothetical protein